MVLKGWRDMAQKQSVEALRKEWADYWGMKPHKGIGLVMLEKSLAYKKNEALAPKHQMRLETLIKQYKRNPTCFDGDNNPLKPGTRLVRDWKGKRHVVTVKTEGFDYSGKEFKSLSAIANLITGSRWNGHVFFGVRN